MEYSFSQLVNLDELRALSEQFTQLTGFVTAILDLEGNVLVATGWQEICTHFHRATPGTALKCRESDTILAKQLWEGHDFSLYRCGNGLIDVAVPIAINGVQVARLYSGQFLFEPPDLEFFQRQAAEFGFNVTSYLEAVRKVPVVTEEQVRLVMGFLCRLAEMIGRMGVTNKRVMDVNLIIEDSPAVLFRWKTSEGWPIEFVSENVIQFGYTPEELMTGEVSYTSMVYPGDLERIISVANDYTFRGVDHLHLEYRIVTKRGELRWVEDRTTTERDAEGRSTIHRGVVFDITERKRAEEALRLTQYCVDNASIGICIADSDRIMQTNEQMCRQLGYSREELSSLSIPDIDAFFSQEQFNQLFRQTIQDGRTSFESLHRRKDGTIFPVEISSAMLHFEGREICVSFCLDSTKRKQSEQALRESEEKFRLLAETSPNAILLCREERITYANPAASKLSGYSGEELARMNFWEFVHADFRELVLHRGLARQRRESVPIQYGCRIVTKSGVDRWVLVSGAPMEYEGMPTSIVNLLDVTDAKQAEEALRESEERLRLALAASKHAFYDIDVRSGVAQLSPEFPLMLGYAPEEYIPTLDNLRELMHPDDRERAFGAYESTVEGVSADFSAEYRHRTKTGGWKWLLSLGKVMAHDADGKALRLMGTVADISERKTTEEQIRASLAEKTILLKEVHHRVKNNLQIICSLLDLQSDSVLDEQSRRYFQESRDRIRSMAFAHEQLYRSRNLSSIDFVEYLENLATFLINSYASDPGLISLRINADTLSLGIDLSISCGLILNELISNALKHAFPDNREGIVTISLSSGPDGLTALSVADDGVGFPADVDFRNTQSLGLQLVNILVKQLHGRIELLKDVGSTFVIQFNGTVARGSG